MRLKTAFVLLAIVALAACQLEQPVAPSPQPIDISINNFLNNDNKNEDADGGGNGNGGDPGDDDGGTDVNRSPFVVNPGPQTNQVGDSVSLIINGSDPDGDELDFTWVANTAPRNLTLQNLGNNSALISGTISSSSVDDSPFSTTVIARELNSGGLSGSTTFSWTITPAP